MLLGAADMARLAEGVDRCPACDGDCEWRPEGHTFSFEDFARPLEPGDVEPWWEARCIACGTVHEDCGPPPCVRDYRLLSRDARESLDQWIVRYLDEVGRATAEMTSLPMQTGLGLFFPVAHEPRDMGGIRISGRVNVYFVPSRQLHEALPEPRIDAAFYADAVAGPGTLLTPVDDPDDRIELGGAGSVPDDDNTDFIMHDMAAHVTAAACELVSRGRVVKLGWVGRLRPRVVDTAGGARWLVVFERSAELADELESAAARRGW